MTRGLKITREGSFRFSSLIKKLSHEAKKMYLAFIIEINIDHNKCSINKIIIKKKLKKY